ncbi:MAG: DUF4860 domain-containing protein [Oscillospiraceae bacterium]|nr:DUF4860 domain-containing protein [Oscillospiraceae bacterium]
MNKRVTKITDLLALLVFAVFAVCVLLVLLYGARVYQNLVQRGEESFQMRTAAQYVSMRVRQAQNVTVTDFEGCQALTVYEQIDGAVYVTRVYCYDGYIRELFSAENAELEPKSGEKLMPAQSLHFSVENGMLTASVDGRTVMLQLRGKEGGLP